MKIRKLQLKNIGVFDYEEIEFKECPAKDKAEIHILTGENGSGKTTILMALATVFDNLGEGWESEQPVDYLLISSKSNTLRKRMWKDGRNSVFSFEFEDSGERRSYEAAIRLEDVYTVKPYSVTNKIDKKFLSYRNVELFQFVAFAYSGYHRVKDEKINLFDEIKENPMNQALDFVKTENSKFTINQWIGKNLQKRSLANEEDNKIEANRFAENIKNLEKVIADIVGYEIRFKLKIDLSLVLIKDNQELDFDVLPDGLKSLISWIGDLLMRLDSLKWKNDTPIFDREIILFLDEIEVHLHPAWQRKVLPIVQKLFKNAQIFVSTHSPFVVNSVDDAWVYELEVKDGKAKVREVTQSNTAYSIQTVLREIFGIDEKFGEGTQEKLVGFLDKSKQIQRNNGKSEINKDDFLNLAIDLAEKSAEFQSIVFVELAKITQKLGEPYEI